MAKILTLDELQTRFESAKEALNLTRTFIMGSSPLEDGFDPDKYSFIYMRAERIGLEIINHSLEQVAWLPMRLDPEPEIACKNREAIKAWIATAPGEQPDSHSFGNDFIHALTRTALKHGWESAAFKSVGVKLGELFHDLSCLIGLIYYGVWMTENGIEGVLISNPDDLELTAREISNLAKSPEVTEALRQRRVLEAQRRTAEKAEAAELQKRNRDRFHIVPPSGTDQPPQTIN